MRYLFGFLLLPLFAVLTPATAYAWTAAEISAMPPYCAGRYALHDNPAEYKRWAAKYGPDFLHTHHLCDGIGYIDRYFKARSLADKRTALKDAMGNLNYMIQNASSDFGLMPDVYYYRSQVFNLSNNMAEAITDARKAISLDPTHVRAYSQAADYLERIGQRGEALKLVSEGLKHLPENKSLQRAYARLGGKPPYPEPYDKAKVTAENSSAANDTTANPTSTPKLAVFDLSRLLGGGGNVFREAGSYFFIEVSEDPASPESKVRFKLVSRIPQPATRVARIGIDVGQYGGLFTNIQVMEDALFSKYYPLRSGEAFTHAFWGGFRPTYLATFTIDAKAAKMYDPNALPPGGSLTFIATLSPGKSIDDVVEAIKRGFQGSDGLRFAIIAHHTRGFRPNPKETIMDDGGFATGSLRQLSGFAKPAVAVAKDVPPSAADSEAGSAERDSQPPGSAGSSTAATEPENQRSIGTPTNPWCRFCPRSGR